MLCKNAQNKTYIKSQSKICQIEDNAMKNKLNIFMTQ